MKIKQSNVSLASHNEVYYLYYRKLLLPHHEFRSKLRKVVAYVQSLTE